MQTMGERVKAVRELKKMSQFEVSEKLGVNQTSYSKIERGGNTKHIIQLAKIFECDPVWLQTGKGFSPFSKTFQYLGGCTQVPLVNLKYLKEFLKDDHHSPTIAGQGQ
jgi:transcriptional regulator with XRE-family HTH domain